LRLASVPEARALYELTVRSEINRIPPASGPTDVSAFVMHLGMCGLILGVGLLAFLLIHNWQFLIHWISKPSHLVAAGGSLAFLSSLLWTEGAGATLSSQKELERKVLRLNSYPLAETEREKQFNEILDGHTNDLAVFYKALRSGVSTHEVLLPQTIRLLADKRLQDRKLSDLEANRLKKASTLSKKDFLFLRKITAETNEGPGQLLQLMLMTDLGFSVKRMKQNYLVLLIAT